jgi:hypothetical protein
MKLIRLTFLLFALAATGCVTKSPRWTSDPSAQRAVLEPPPLRVPEPSRLWTLMPEATSQPAVLMGKKSELVSGDHAFVDFQALLRLVGRVDRVDGIVGRAVRHQVLFIRFFEGFAALVWVDGVIFKCARTPDGEWQIVGVSLYDF